METSIGVFVSRRTAEEALNGLLSKNVPKDSIVFLTRADSKATFHDLDEKYAQAFAGGTTGMILAAVMLLAVPGVGEVVGVGFGAAALLGLIGAGAGLAVGKAVEGLSDRRRPPGDEESSKDAAFFREVLQQNRSLVIVRTDSQAIAKTATGVLDRLGIGMEKLTSIRMRTAIREVGGITGVDISGRITLGEDSVMLREIVRDLLTKGKTMIFLNLGEVEYVDSAGIGELIQTFTTIRNQGGQMKLVNLNKRVQDLLVMTNLHKVFEIHDDEASAIKSFGGHVAAGTVS
jgi:anti-sigma B factor antagonist